MPSLPVLFAGEEGFPLPRHVIERHGSAWTRAGTHVGNGAFALAERRAARRDPAQRNPGSTPQARRPRGRAYLPSDDLRTMVSRFRAGDLDVNGWPGFPVQQGPALKRELGAQVRVSPLQSVRYLRFNTARPPSTTRGCVVRCRWRWTARCWCAHHDWRRTRGAARPARGAARRPRTRRQPARAGTAATRTRGGARLLVGRAIARGAPAPIRLRVPCRQRRRPVPRGRGDVDPAGAPARIEKSEIKSMIADLRRGDFDVALTGAQDTPTVEAYLERFRPRLELQHRPLWQSGVRAAPRCGAAPASTPERRPRPARGGTRADA